SACQQRSVDRRAFRGRGSDEIAGQCRRKWWWCERIRVDTRLLARMGPPGSSGPPSARAGGAGRSLRPLAGSGCWRTAGGEADPDEARAVHPGTAAAYVLAGVLLVAAGNRPAAISRYQTALRLGRAPWAAMAAEELARLSTGPQT